MATPTSDGASSHLRSPSRDGYHPVRSSPYPNSPLLDGEEKLVSGASGGSDSSSGPGVARLALLLLAITLSAILSTSLQSLHHPIVSKPHRGPKRVVIKTVDDNGSGLGSVMEQLARSVVFAQAFDAELFAVESEGGRGYDTVAALNQRRDTRVKVDFERVCRVSKYMNQTTYKAFTTAACDAQEMGTALSAADLSLVEDLIGCTVLLQDEPWENDPKLVRCTWRHTAKLFGNPSPRAEERVAVGLHKRFGDLATGGRDDDPTNSYRSIPAADVNRILSGLEKCLGPLDVRLYMEQHTRGNSTFLAGVTHPFTLVDTGEDVDDLIDLASNDILVVAGSSFTVLAHAMARGGLTVVPDDDPARPVKRRWNTTGTHEVVNWREFSSKVDCEEIRRLYRTGKARSKKEVARLVAVAKSPEGSVALVPGLPRH